MCSRGVILALGQESKWYTLICEKEKSGAVSGHSR